MKHQLAIFYHGLFVLGDPTEFCETAIAIVFEHMQTIRDVGLLNAADHFCVGINGDRESLLIAHMTIPSKAEIILHGLQCHTENRTIRLIEEWLPSHEDWYVLYFHAKGCTHPPGDPMRTRWRRCMGNTVLLNWRRCVSDLDAGYEVVGVHYMQPPATPPGQYIMAGNFMWSKATYLLTLPSILKRDRIIKSGLDALESRFESEVWIGNGPRPPRVRDYHGPGWNPSKIASCSL